MLLAMDLSGCTLQHCKTKEEDDEHSFGDGLELVTM